MSEVNIGSQTLIWDFRFPIKGATFNKFARDIVKPGIYKGMTISFTGDTVFVDAGKIFINCKFDDRDNLASKIDFDSILVLEGIQQLVYGFNDVLYLTFEYAEITDNFAELNRVSLQSWLASPDPNGIVVGEIEYDPSTPFSITGVNYDRKTWGSINADADHSKPDDLIYSNTENTNKKWKVKGYNLSENETELSYQDLTETEARIPLTNSTNITVIENRLQVAKFDGRVPLGGVVGVVGTFNSANNGGGVITPTGIPSSGVVSDDGFQRCDGVAVGSGAILTGYVPKINDDRFIQGSSSLGTVGGNTSNQKTLSISEMPSHNHGGTTSIDGEHQHTYTRFTDQIDVVVAPPALYDMWRGNSGVLTFASGNHSHTISSQGGGSTFDIRPLFISAIYLIRVGIQTI